MKNNLFFSRVILPKSDILLTYNSPVLLLGSCFAQNIGEKLVDNKFNITINPLGVIYNPISIIKGLHRIIKNQLYTEKDLIPFNGKWISFDHHGSFSSFNKKECLEKINSSIQKSHQDLLKSKIIFLTFGSAWVYEYPNFGIVANCHKIPNKQFTKRLLTAKEVVLAFNELMKELKVENSNVDVVFTVSPVRHIKDGLHENNLSKSVLHLAINDIVCEHTNCHYFPAYELVVDELRDYRFFKDDLVHPTKMAINYVWEKFTETYCDDNTQQLIDAITKIKQAVNHKPFNFESEAHQKFIEQQIELMDQLVQQHSFLNFEEEKTRLLRM